ncbi:MAG: hypothetical protein QME27_06155 [Syntrophaceae bacterium]|nr:hypothetical protein [Syntrophaceae bacterium]
MSGQHGDSGIDARQEPSFLSDKEICMIPDSTPDIGEGLIVGAKHRHEIIEGAEKQFSVLPPSMEVAEGQEKGKRDKEKKDGLR